MIYLVIARQSGWHPEGSKCLLLLGSQLYQRLSDGEKRETLRWLASIAVGSIPHGRDSYPTGCSCWKVVR